MRKARNLRVAQARRERMDHEYALKAQIRAFNAEIGRTGLYMDETGYIRQRSCPIDPATTEIDAGRSSAFKKLSSWFSACTPG